MLQVAIISTPENEAFTYPAGLSVTLTCNAEEGYQQPSYLWNSTCNNCLVHGQTTKSVILPILHSRDTGSHTCMVTDYIGHTGSATIEMRITGILNNLSAIPNHLYRGHVHTAIHIVQMFLHYMLTRQYFKTALHLQVLGFT